MALERIAAIGYAAPVRNAPGAGGRAPAPGDTIALTFRAAAADELLATTAEGLSLKLAGLGTLGRQLAIGDVLLVKVLSTSPRLELALFDRAVHADDARAHGGPGGDVPAGFEHEQAAMRPDQVAWLRQVVWRPPDPATLAAAWRASMLDQLERQAAWRAQSEGPRAGAAAVEPGPMPAADDLYFQTLTAPPAADPWTLAVYAWGGLRLQLRALAPGRESPPRRRPGAPALRVTLSLPGLGGILVQLQLSSGGLLLDLVAERAEALPVLRERLPAIVAALARAELRVLRCRTLQAPDDGAAIAAAADELDSGPRWAAQALAAPAATLPPGLFRAAAELVAALRSPWQSAPGPVPVAWPEAPPMRRLPPS